LQLAPLRETAKTLGSRPGWPVKSARDAPTLRNDAGLSHALDRRAAQPRRDSAHQGEAGGPRFTSRGSDQPPGLRPCSIYFGMVGSRPLLRGLGWSFSRKPCRLPGDGPDHPSLSAANLEPRTPCWCLHASWWFRELQRLWLGNTASPLALLVRPLAASPSGGDIPQAGAWLARPAVLSAPTARRLQRGPPDSSRRGSGVAAGPGGATAQSGPSWFAGDPAAQVRARRPAVAHAPDSWRGWHAAPDCCPAAANWRGGFADWAGPA